MKAAQLNKTGDMTISDIAAPLCGCGDIIVRVEACSLCSSDLKMLYHGHRDLILPRVLGHELAGVVVKIGRDVKGFKKGDRVQVAPGVPCGKCRYCREGNDNMCDEMRISGFHLNGGMAQEILVPHKGIEAGVVNIIPDSLSFEKACFAEPIACCINALTVGRFRAGDMAVVFGAGPIGCLLAQLLKYKKAAKIFLVEKDKQRLEFVSQYGIGHLLNWGIDDVFSVINEAANGRGVDFIISACTESAIPQQGIEVLAKRGRMVFFSGLMGENKTTVDYSSIHYKELMIQGAYGCTVEQNREALTLLAENKIEIKPLITHHFPLDEIHKAFEIVKNKQGMKVIINDFS